MTDKVGMKRLEELQYAHALLQTAHLSLKADWEALQTAHSVLLRNRDDVSGQLDQLRLQHATLLRENERLREQLGHADSRPGLDLDEEEGA